MNIKILIIINSPLEQSEVGETLVELLHYTMVMNVCNMVLLVILFTTFLQILAVLNLLNLDFIDNLHFLKGLKDPIKRILVKWQSLISKSLFIYFFVWWLIVYISVYSSIDNLQFIINHLVAGGGAGAVALL